MIRGYRDFYYNVTDMNRAVIFYTESLGMKKTYGHEHWTSLQVGNLHLGLHWTNGAHIPETPRDSHGQHCGGTLTLFSDDIASDRQRIETNGGKILGETKQPWGHMLTFEDIDGNVLKLINDQN